MLYLEIFDSAERKLRGSRAINSGIICRHHEIESKTTMSIFLVFRSQFGEMQKKTFILTTV